MIIENLMLDQFMYYFLRIIDRFYARDVKVVKTHLTSETSTNDGVTMGRLRADDNSEKKRIFPDSSQSILDKLGINAFQVTVSHFYTRRIQRLRP